MESQPQNPELRNNPENFHPLINHVMFMFNIPPTAKVTHRRSCEDVATT